MTIPEPIETLIAPPPQAYSALVWTERTPPPARELLAAVTPQALAGSDYTLAAGWTMLAGLWLWNDGLAECHQIAQKTAEDLRRAAPIKIAPGAFPSRTLTSGGNTGAATTPGTALPIRTESAAPARNLPDDAEQKVATLALWHAIMHRREADFSNSKYWYAQAGKHPAFAVIAGRVASVINPLPADRSLLRLVTSAWNPAAFVDLVEAVHELPEDPRHGLAVAIQRIEWRVVFESCFS